MDGLMMIVNPAAGGGRCGRTWPLLARRLRDDGLVFTTRLTERPGHARQLTRQALLDGATTIVAVGGDGLLNEVINGFLEDDRPVNPTARLGVVSVGTGNDYARMFGYDQAADLAALGPGGQVHRLDVMRVNFTTPDGETRQRYGLAHAAVGIVAAGTGIRLPGWLRRVAGPLSYPLMGVLALTRHRAYPVAWWVDDALAERTHIAGLIAANGACMGGGMRVAPDARLDDGLVEIISVGALGRLTLLLRILPGLYDASYLRHPAARHQRARRFRIESEAPLPLEIDGDVVGQAPLQIEVVPAVLPVLVPPDSAR